MTSVPPELPELLEEDVPEEQAVSNSMAEVVIHETTRSFINPQRGKCATQPLYPTYKGKIVSLLGSAVVRAKLSKKSKLRYMGQAWEPKSGDKVYRKGSDSVWVISALTRNGKCAGLYLEHTELEWFSYPVEDLRPVSVAKKPPQPVRPPKKSTRKTR